MSCNCLQCPCFTPIRQCGNHCSIHHSQIHPVCQFLPSQHCDSNCPNHPWHYSYTLLHFTVHTPITTDHCPKVLHLLYSFHFHTLNFDITHLMLSSNPHDPRLLPVCLLSPFIQSIIQLLQIVLQYFLSFRQHHLVICKQ